GACTGQAPAALAKRRGLFCWGAYTISSLFSHDKNMKQILLHCSGKQKGTEGFIYNQKILSDILERVN
ncbi:MAG: hypothetical protein LBB61_03015, partial [Treponema sp.]|nr:hypothetical protein [Treponema sp.]